MARTLVKARPGCTPNGFDWWYKEHHGAYPLNVSGRRPGSKRSDILGDQQLPCTAAGHMGSVLVEYVVGSLAREKLADVDFGRCIGLPLGVGDLF